MEITSLCGNIRINGCILGPYRLGFTNVFLSQRDLYDANQNVK